VSAHGQQGQQHDRLLLWQRSCMPGLMGVASVLGLVCGARFVPRSQGRGQLYGAASDGEQLAQLLVDVLGLATKWLQQGVQAACALQHAVSASGASGALLSGGAGAAGGSAGAPAHNRQQASELIKVRACRVCCRCASCTVQDRAS
jgi:hypothetical protein